MADEYETLLEMARFQQRQAACWHGLGHRYRKTTAGVYAEARALYAGAEALRRERKAASVHDVAADLRAWSNGALAPVTGMGAGLHAEMWPHIGPSGARLLRELADRLEDTDG